MKRNDARKLDAKTLTEIRIRAVRQVNSGISPEIIARAMGINRVTIYGWLALYRDGGMKALQAKSRGGRQNKLTEWRIKRIYDIITMKNPLQLKFPFALWTSKMVAELIARKYKIKLSKATVCRLLNKMGLTPQRPIWRAYQQKPKNVRKWLDEVYPDIKKMAKRLDAIIYFGDEAGIRSDYHSGTTWAKIGKTPIVKTTGARFGMNMLSVVSAKGDFRFMTVKGKLNSKIFIEFIKRLIHGSDRMTFLIVDGHPMHKARSVETFVDTVSNRFRIYYLPPYSPELNPDELVWNDLKNNGLGRKSIENPEQLKKDASNYMRMIQKTPARVSSYFKSKTTKYAS